MAQIFVSPNRPSSPAPSTICSTLEGGTIAPLPSIPSLSNGSTTTSSPSIESSRSAHPLHYYDMHDQTANDDALRETSPTQHHDQFLFPCLLRFLPCSFTSDVEQEWKTHSLSHFHPFGPPPRTSCPFCHISLPTNPSDTPLLAWQSRTDHMVFQHRDSLTQATAQADFPAYEYMWKVGLLKHAQLKEIKGNARFGEKMEEEPVTYTLSASTRRDERHRRTNGRGRDKISDFEA